MPPPLPRPALLPKPQITPASTLLRLLSTTVAATDTEASRNSRRPAATSEKDDPCRLLMKEDPINICSSLWLHSFSIHINSKNSETSISRPTFSNLTGYLKKFDLLILAYQRSCAAFTGSFPAPTSIHHSVLHSLLSFQRSLLSSPSSPSPFRWGSFSNQLLRSPAEPPVSPSKSKLRDILAQGKPLFQDHVVQELLLLILEPVFEPRFSTKSHGFRPGRSPHTVLRTIRSNFAGYLWFIKADLTAVSDQLPVALIMDCLQKGVKDRNILRLIKSALRTPVARSAGVAADGKKRYVDPRKMKLANKRLKRKVMRMVRRKKVLKEDEPKPDPYWLRVFYSFAPREASHVPEYGYCGILSPLLVNLCLNELDAWMDAKMADYFCPSKLDSIWKESINDGCHNPSWPEFVPSSGREKTRRMDYIRYGSHILIGMRGPREDAVRMRKELIEFCEEKYEIKLENSRVEIEHITRGIQFLDHIICRRVIYPTLRYTSTGGKIVSQKGIGTLLSVTASLERCISQFRKLDLLKGDKDPEPLPCVAMFYSGQAHTNAQMNKFLETMADWYRYADNRKKIVGFCAYVIRSSLAKLYAARYRLKSRAKVYKIASRDLSRPLIESTRNDMPEYSDLLRMGLVDAIDGVQFSHMSLIPSCDYTPFPRNWIPAHEQLLQEYIKLQDPNFFCKLYKSVKQHDLSLPQDDLSKVVWDCKNHGVHSCHFQQNMKKLGSFTFEGSSQNTSCVTG